MSMVLLTIISIFASVIAMGVNYLFHFVMVRLLPPADYGVLGVIVGIFAILTVPISSIQAVMAREVAKLDAEGRNEKINFVLHKYIKSAAVYGSVIALLLCAFAYLQGSFEIGVIIALCVPIAYVTGVILGYLQGKERILQLCTVAPSAAIMKLLIAISLVYSGFGLLGAVEAFPLSGMIVLVPLLIYAMSRNQLEKHTIELKKSISKILITNVLLMIFLYLDLFFVRMYLHPDAAGYFNAAEITAKILFFLSASIVVVLLPKASKLDISNNKKEIVEILLKASAFLPPVLMVFLLIPYQMMGVFFTEAYAGFATEPFMLLSVGMFFVGLFFILLNFMWAQKEEIFPLQLVIVVISIHLLFLANFVPGREIADGLRGAATATAVSSFLLFAPSLVFVARKLTARKVVQ